MQGHNSSVPSENWGQYIGNGSWDITLYSKNSNHWLKINLLYQMCYHFNSLYHLIILHLSLSRVLLFVDKLFTFVIIFEFLRVEILISICLFIWPNMFTLIFIFISFQQLYPGLLRRLSDPNIPTWFFQLSYPPVLSSVCYLCIISHGLITTFPLYICSAMPDFNVSSQKWN